MSLAAGLLLEWVAAEILPALIVDVSARHSAGDRSSRFEVDPATG
jgi:hypothetical protein